MHYQTLGRCWQSDLLATLESCRQSLRLGLARNHLPPGKISAGPILGLQVRHIHVLRDVSSFYLLVDGLLVHEDLRRDECLLGVPGQGGPLQDPELPTFGGQQLLAAARENCTENLNRLFVADVNDLVHGMVQHFGCLPNAGQRLVGSPALGLVIRDAPASIANLEGVDPPQAAHLRVNITLLWAGRPRLSPGALLWLRSRSALCIRRR